MNDRQILRRDDREEFERHVRALDTAYLRLAHEKMRKAQEKMAKNNKNSVKGGARR